MKALWNSSVHVYGVLVVGLYNIENYVLGLLLKILLDIIAILQLLIDTVYDHL